MGLEDTLRGQLEDHQNGHIMLVDGLYKLTTHKVKTCQSSEFQASGLKWKLYVFPAGSDGRKDHISFFLRIKDTESLPTNWEVNCTITVSILAQIGSDNYTKRRNACYEAKRAGSGWRDFMSHAVLMTNGYLVNDRVVFMAEVTNVIPNFQVAVVPRTMGTGERLKLFDVPPNNSRFTWKITRFSTFHSESHSSYEFTAGSRRWRLLMYPKGNLAGKGNSLSLYLHATDYVTFGPKAKTLAVYKLRVYDQLNRNHYETSYNRWFVYDPDNPEQCIWGSDKYLPHEILHDPSRGLLVKDEILIGVEFLLLSTTHYL